MAYAVEISPAAERQIAKLDRSIRERIVRRVETLATEPRPPGVVKLQGPENFYRMRAAKDYRIIYQIRDEALLVLVLKVGHRREVYRGL